MTEEMAKRVRIFVDTRTKDPDFTFVFFDPKESDSK